MKKMYRVDIIGKNSFSPEKPNDLVDEMLSEKLFCDDVEIVEKIENLRKEFLTSDYRVTVFDCGNEVVIKHFSNIENGKRFSDLTDLCA